mmetsp:Transcript_11910/g.23980  ORF Transcript_11910/g.23980 Transcript_11910/m.23980 type:complete len:307 (-) Transcript_11910:2043-2963(-)
MLSLLRTMSTSRPRPFAARRAFVGCAAAFGTLSSSTCWAFVQPHRSTLPASSAAVVPTSSSVNYDLDFNSNINYVLTSYPNRPHQQQSTRLFFSMRNNNNNEDDDWKTLKKAGGNILKKAGSKIKSIIPFGSKTEEEKLAKQRKAEIKGGINTMLKDMPLPVRLMGRMVAPLLSKAADQIAEQSRQAADMMEEARARIVNDPAVTSKLGEPVQVGQPFSQSSSTMVINGKSSARIKISFQVGGPYGNGVATMESADGEIVNLVVNVNGMNINVGSGGYKFGSSSPTSSSSSSKKGDIIEAEIIEKK